jgi:hypothetical protein
LSGGSEGGTRQAHDEDDACGRQHASVLVHVVDFHYSATRLLEPRV